MGEALGDLLTDSLANDRKLDCSCVPTTGPLARSQLGRAEPLPRTQNIRLDEYMSFRNIWAKWYSGTKFPGTQRFLSAPDYNTPE